MAHTHPARVDNEATYRSAFVTGTLFAAQNPAAATGLFQAAQEGRPLPADLGLTHVDADADILHALGHITRETHT